MANNSVSDFSLFINRQLYQQEQIEAYLWQLEALITVAVKSEGVYELSENTLQNYFSIVAELIQKILKVNQQSLRELISSKFE